MADEITSNIAMTDPTITSALGLPENQYGVDIMPLIAPEVEVYTKNVKARVFGKSAGRKVAKVTRPRGGDSERVQYAYEDPKSFTIEEKSLKDVLDRRDIEEARNAPDGGFDLRLKTALNVSGQLRTTIEYDAATMFLDSASYPTEAKDAVGTTFSGASTRALIRAEQDRIIKTWGIRPGLLILTPEAWAEVEDNSTIIDRIKYTDGGPLTEEIVARYLGVDKLVVPRTVWYDDDGAGTYVWAGKKGILLPTTPNPGMNGPCFAKRFYRKINGAREEVRTAFDMPGNEHFYNFREEETAIVFADAAHIWY
jgi:hypothetical protein